MMISHWLSVAGACVDTCVVASGVVGVNVSKVYAVVGDGIDFNNCTNSSCSLVAISVFLYFLLSFLLHYNVLESIYIIVTCLQISICIPLIPVSWSSNSLLVVDYSYSSKIQS